MKKIFFASVLLLIFAITAQAQRGLRNYRTRPAKITRLERLQLQKDVVQMRMAQRHAERDGIVTPYERRNIHRLKQKTRRDAFRFRHNGRSRVI